MDDEQVNFVLNYIKDDNIYHLKNTNIDKIFKITAAIEPDKVKDGYSSEYIIAVLKNGKIIKETMRKVVFDNFKQNGFLKELDLSDSERAKYSLMGLS